MSIRKKTSRLAMVLLCIVVLAPIVPTIASPPLENAACPLSQLADTQDVELVGQIGGATYAVAVQGDYAYIGIGPRLVILDVSEPASPAVVGRTTPLPGIVRDVAVSRRYAYVSAGEAGMRVVDISTPSSPHEVASYSVPSAVRGISVAGDYAYVAIGHAGLRIVNISTPSDPTEVGSYDTAGSAEGVAIAVSDPQGHTYAYVTDGNEGLRVVDISTPANPTEVGHALEGAWGNVIIDGEYAYVANMAGLRVVDTSASTDPKELGAYNTPGSATNVAVAGGYAYIADKDGGLRVVDISTPSSPAEVGIFDIPGDVEDVAVTGGYAYVADGDGGLRVVDISTPSSPAEVGFYDTPGLVNDVAIVDDFAYVAAGSEGLWVVDVSAIADPKRVGSYDTPGIASKIVVAASDPQGHTYAYVADGEGGVRIVDVSAPTNPREVGFYDTPGTTSDVAVAGGYAYVGDYSYDSYHHGLQVVDVSTPAHPKVVGYYKAPGAIKAVAIAAGDPHDHTYAYVAAYDWGVRVVDVTVPQNPVEVGVFSTSGWNMDIAVATGGSQGRTYAYVAARENNLQVVDVSVPSNPRVVGDVLDLATGVAVDQGLAYVVTGGFAAPRTGLQVVDITAPTDPKEVGLYYTPGSASGAAADENYACVADGTGGLLILRYTGEKGRIEPPVDAPTPEIELEPSVARSIPFELRDSREWIAFVGMNRNIWVIHADGTELHQVTTDAVVRQNEYGREYQGVGYSDPKWSPTGERLAFVRYDRDSTTHSLMMLEIGASELTTLTSDTAGGFDWGPVGNRIVYDKPASAVWEGIRGKWVDYDGLWVLDLGSGQESLLVSPQSEQALFRPDWSPDGKRIAFSDTGLCYEFCPFDVSVADLENDSAYSSLNPDKSWSPVCDWSPDGAQLACADHPGHPDIDPAPLRILDYRGVLVAELPEKDITADRAPLWSPDGRYVAVEASVGGLVGGEYISPESFTDIMSPDGAERRRIASGVPVGWSSDGKWLLIIDEENRISAIQVDTGAAVVIAEGYDADWQPQPVLPPSLDDLLAAKRSVIPELERMTYDYVYGSAQVPIDAYDESAAEALLAELGQADSDTVSPEQVAAVARLVLQEQALAETLADYSKLSDDLADTQVDIAGLCWGTSALLAKAGVAPGTLVHDLTDKILWDIVRVLASGIADGEFRKLVYSNISLTSDALSSLDGDPTDALTALTAEHIRADVAAENIAGLVNYVQPTIDQGVGSISGGDGETWMVEDTYGMAVLQLGHITTTSQIRQETAHSQYEQLVEALAVNELLTDITDAVSVSTGSLPIPKLFSLWTRIQQVLVDLWAQSIIADNMACIRQISGRAGELAFQPGQLMATCEDPRAAVIPWIDGGAWRKLQPQLENTLVDHETVVQAVREAVQSGDFQQVQEAAGRLTMIQSDLTTSSQAALALLAPPSGEPWSPEAGTMAQQIVSLKLEMIGLQLGLTACLDDPDSQEAREYVDLYARRILEGAAAVEDQAGDSSQVYLPLITKAVQDLARTLPTSQDTLGISDTVSLLENVRRFGRAVERGDIMDESAPLPLVTETPAELETISGQPVSIEVHVQNVGSATLADATLTASVGQAVLDSCPVPDVEAGESVELALSFTPSAEGWSMILLELDDGRHNDLRFVPLTVQPAPVTPTPVPTVSSEESSPTEGGQEEEIKVPSSRLPILIGVMVVAAALTVVLGVLALRQIRSPRTCPKCEFAGNPPKAAYCIECGAPLPRRSPAVLIGLGASVLVLVGTVILWQTGVLEERVESSTVQATDQPSTPTVTSSPTPEPATPMGTTIAPTALSPIRTPTRPSVLDQSPIATPTP